MLADDSPDTSEAALELSNPHMTHMAHQIFDRLISHSKFASTMLDMTHSVLPLPEALQKLKLQLPLTSILPLVHFQPASDVSPDCVDNCMYAHVSCPCSVAAALFMVCCQSMSGNRQLVTQMLHQSLRAVNPCLHACALSPGLQQYVHDEHRQGCQVCY